MTSSVISQHLILQSPELGLGTSDRYGSMADAAEMGLAWTELLRSRRTVFFICSAPSLIEDCFIYLV